MTYIDFRDAMATVVATNPQIGTSICLDLTQSQLLQTVPLYLEPSPPGLSEI